MDSCESCGGTQLSQVGSHLTCTDCGLMCQHRPIYTWSYNQSHAPIRQRAIYNRSKRFIEFIRSFKHDAFNGMLNPILDMYNLIEFYFAMYVKGEERKYFYSRKVVLYYIADRLNLDIELPLLKDKDRNIAQLESITALRKHAMAGQIF